MDDSDLALDMALERLDESSDIEEDSQTGSIYSGDGVSQLEVYTPSNLPSNPKPGYAARRGSLHQSGSEDSNSLSSFCTDSDAGPARSAVYCRPSRSNLTNGNRRGVMSDSETTRPRKPLGRYSGACLDVNSRVPEEEFFYRIRERLLAVNKDREGMTMRARDLARQRGETYENIMAMEWYEVPGARKYLFNHSTTEPVELMEETSNVKGLVQGLVEDIVEDRDERPSSPRLTISPSELTPRSAISEMEASRMLSASSQHQLDEGMRSLHVNGMTRSKRSQRHLSGSSSVLSATSDSGVGDTWVTSEMTTPSIDRIQAYLQRQNILSTSLPPRERDAHAAAVALISNSPHAENLNPEVPMHLSRHHHHHHHYQRNGHTHDTDHHQARQQQRVANMPPYSSGDDNSSVFTITSQSSTSDLFIPRKAHQHSVYTDSEEPHHFGNKSYRRMLTTPKRSHMKQHGQGPSPLTEQHRPRMAQTPQQGNMMLSAPQQSQQQQHSMSPGGSGGSVGGGASSGTVHVIYHLDNIPTPFHAKWTNGVGITLGTFKEQVFARKGEYRFFFESFNPDLDMALLEEFTEEDTCLPIIRGKIVGRVERAQ